jgi:hypothetical protein
LHDLDCFRVGKTGYANDIEEVDLFGGAAWIERRPQRGLKFGIGRSGETAALACDAQDIGVRPAIVVKVPDGVAEPGSRIEAAVLALIVGEAFEAQRPVDRARGRPADKQRDRRRDAGNRSRAGWEFLDGKFPVSASPSSLSLRSSYAGHAPSWRSSCSCATHSPPGRSVASISRFASEIWWARQGSNL